jgi:hypothetical protein
MATRVVWDRGQGFGQLCFGRREGCRGICDEEESALGRLRVRRSNERVDIAGTEKSGVSGISLSRAKGRAGRPDHVIGEGCYGWVR